MKSHGVASGARGGQASSILVNCAPRGEMHNYCTPHIIKKKLWEFLDPSVQPCTPISSELCMTSC